MTKFLLAIHVLAAIVAIGPVTVAASMFPPAARHALADPHDEHALAIVRNLSRICRIYAVVGVVVPVFGLGVALNMDVLGDTWLIVSIVLTALAAAVLALLVLPRQDALLTTIATTEPAPAPTPGHTAEPVLATATEPTRTPPLTPTPPAQPSAAHRATVRLAMFTGIFNLLWATVTVLMIVRPGSTTGA
ncbi:protease [Embleya sp. NPDC050493]|uniref:protease n=1 Tax=Embleya sp. NPDC050493 TaxID=3363989 RepID=UPI003798E3FE